MRPISTIQLISTNACIRVATSLLCGLGLGENAKRYGEIQALSHRVMASPERSRSAPLRTRHRALLGIRRCDTMCHMKTITIRELHQATGRWVRQAQAGEVYVTDRGQLIAKLVPASPVPAKPYFAHPKFTRAFLAQRKHLRGGTDSTETISQERDREIR